MYIYKTTNQINGKIYIGKCKKPANETLDYLGSGILLKKAIEKYGIENFKKEILDYASDLNSLNKKEIVWIKYTSSCDRNIGYNISKGGDGGFINPVSKEVHEKRKSPDIYGISDYQRAVLKSWNTRYKENTVKQSVTKMNDTKQKLVTDNITIAQRSARKAAYTRKNTYCKNGKTIQQNFNDKIKNIWKNKSNDEINEFKKIRSRIAKEQIRNEPAHIKNKRMGALKNACTNTVSCFDIITKEYKRVGNNEYYNNPYLVSPKWKGFYEVIYSNGSKILVTKWQLISKLAKEMNISDDWFRKRENNVPFKHRFKKQSHLDGIIVNFIDKKYTDKYFIDNIGKYKIYK